MNIEFSDVRTAELFNTEKKLRSRYGAELGQGNYEAPGGRRGRRVFGGYAESARQMA